MRDLIKKILKEDFGWAQEAEINWSTFYSEILENIQSLPEDFESVTEEMVMPIWMKLDPLTKQAEENSKLVHKNLMNEIWWEFEYLVSRLGKGELTQRKYDINRNLLIELLGQLIGRLRSINESEFDWTGHVDIAPNYQGHPQGVVHLRSHAEITEFFDLIGSTYGIVGKRKNELEKTKSDFHNALDETIGRFESEEWDGYDDWVPAISASFFISKQDPTKYDTGYWDYDVDEGSVEDWLVNQGCEEEVIDCDNWKVYTDISQLRTLFNDYTGEVLHKTKSGKPIKVGDKVKVIDPESNQYGEVLEVEHLVGGDGYEKHGGAFQTIEFDTLYFAGHEVEHIEDLNEDFDWVSDVGPLHGFKFKVNHNSYTYVIDDTGDDTLGVRIVGDDDYHSTTTRDEVKNNLRRRLWHDVKTYKFNPNLKIREDFDWTESVPNPGKYDIFDLDILIMMNNIKIGDRIHLKGHAKDVDIVFDHVGTIYNVKRENSIYDEDTLESSISIRFDDPNLLHGRGFRGSSINEYELADTFADQEELTFDIVSRYSEPVNESNEFDWTDIDPSTLHKPYIGMKFRTKDNPNSIYEIYDLSSSIVYYKYTSISTGREVTSSIPTIYFKRYMKDGDWVTYYDDVKESTIILNHTIRVNIPLV